MGESSGLFGFMERVGDIVIMNLLFLLTCIPIITIGPSLVALYSVTLKMAAGEEGYAVKAYFNAFAKNFMQGSYVGLADTIIVLIIAANAVCYPLFSGPYKDYYLYAIVIFVCTIALLLSFLAYPLMARYENSFWRTILNSALISISKLPYTLLMVIIAIVPLVITYYFHYAAFYLLFAGFGVTALIQSKILIRVFSKISG